ncbi:class I SAM-dependent methyltransferase, partial [Rhodomicrobium udaipurense]
VMYVQANAESLPYRDNTSDFYTISFGIRNVDNKQNALNEAFRVLKPGGRFLCLEFSRVQVPLFDKVYEVYSDNVVPPLGRVVAG